MSFNSLMLNLRKGGLLGWNGYWQRHVRILLRTLHLN
jgi:hypothetical protein